MKYNHSTRDIELETDVWRGATFADTLEAVKEYTDRVEFISHFDEDETWWQCIAKVSHTDETDGSEVDMTIYSRGKTKTGALRRLHDKLREYA